MSATLSELFGPEWAGVRSVVIDGVELYMAYDISKILHLSNITYALDGVARGNNVDARQRTKKKINSWCPFRMIHLLTIEGVFQMIMNNNSRQCKRIKERMATKWLPKVLDIKIVEPVKKQSK
jgi:hypothetical protein